MKLWINLAIPMPRHLLTFLLLSSIFKQENINQKLPPFSFLVKELLYFHINLQTSLLLLPPNTFVYISLNILDSFVFFDKCYFKTFFLDINIKSLSKRHPKVRETWMNSLLQVYWLNAFSCGMNLSSVSHHVGFSL